MQKHLYVTVHPVEIGPIVKVDFTNEKIFRGGHGDANRGVYTLGSQDEVSYGKRVALS